MALTEQQIKQLDVAYNRVEAAKASGGDMSSFATDERNIAHAKTQGYTPTSVEAAPVVTPEVTPAAPVVDETQTNNNTNPDTTNPPKLNETQMKAEVVDKIVQDNKVFNEIDAKNFAYSKGETNFQQYIGGTGGQSNPLYIGATNWANLQKQYTPYQLQKATMRTKDGIYWNSNVNIGDIPRSDPADLLNNDSDIISGIVSDAKNNADKTISDKNKTSVAPDLSSDVDENTDSIMKMLQNQYGNSAESLYTELFKTPEMDAAKSDVSKYKYQLDEFDQQIEDLKGDIRKEVEGEASDSYINALATIRGENILKQKRSVQRDYDTALGTLNGLKEEATNLLNVRSKDADTRYNRMFSMLQLQLQQEGNEFNQDLAILNATMALPEGRSVTIGGTTIKGMKENDNLNIVSITDADRDMYVVGIDKTTGKEMYKTFLGKAAAPSGGTVNNFQYEYKELEAETKLEQLKKVKTGLAAPVTESGSIRTAVDSNGDTFYYDAYSLNQAEANSLWYKNDKVNPEEHLLYYAK